MYLFWVDVNGYTHHMSWEEIFFTCWYIYTIRETCKAKLCCVYYCSDIKLCLSIEENENCFLPFVCCSRMHIKSTKYKLGTLFLS